MARNRENVDHMTDKMARAAQFEWMGTSELIQNVCWNGTLM